DVSTSVVCNELPEPGHETHVRIEGIETESANAVVDDGHEVDGVRTLIPQTNGGRHELPDMGLRPFEPGISDGGVGRGLVLSHRSPVNRALADVEQNSTELVRHPCPS